MTGVQSVSQPPSVPFGGCLVEWPYVRESYLTNIDALCAECPAEFRDKENPWVKYVGMVQYWMGDRNGVNHWSWKSPDTTVQDKQLAQWHFVTSRSGLSARDSRAVGAWMLSKMLTEVPTFTAPLVHM